VRSKQPSVAWLGDPEEEDSDEDDPSPEDEAEKVNDDDDGEKIFPMDDPDRNASRS
jgi:hypothetical protein